MAVTPQAVKVYPQFALGLGTKAANLSTDNLKMLFLTAYTYAASHTFVSDVLAAGTEVAGTGYTAGGVALTGVAWQAYTGSTWPVIYATSTAYNVGDVVRPSSANGYVYRCAVAGTTAGSAPTWPTVVGTTVVDGSVTWTCVGTDAVRLTCSTVALASSTLSGVKFAVVADTTPGSNATNPVVCYADFANNPQSSSSGTFTYAPPPSGLAVGLVA